MASAPMGADQAHRLLRGKSVAQPLPGPAAVGGLVHAAFATQIDHVGIQGIGDDALDAVVLQAGVGDGVTLTAVGRAVETAHVAADQQLAVPLRAGADGLDPAAAPRPQVVPEGPSGWLLGLEVKRRVASEGHFQRRHLTNECASKNHYECDHKSLRIYPPHRGLDRICRSFVRGVSLENSMPRAGEKHKKKSLRPSGRFEKWQV